MSRLTEIDAERKRWMALYVLCAGVLMIVLDVTVVNVALPSIKRDLGFSQSSLAWVVNSYLIAFGGLLLLSGRMGDLLGHRRVFLVGLVVFTVASFVCGVSQSQTMLVVARFVQGAGGALTSAVVLGMIVTMFPEPREQAKAIGVYGFVASAGGSIGLLAGGVLTQSINWHWIFFINVPIGLLTGFLSLRLLADTPGLGLSAGADVPGAVLLVAALMLGVYTINGPAASHGWGSAQALGLGAGSLLLLGLFVWREAAAAQPLIPLRIFRSRDLSGSNLVQVLVVAGMFGLFFMGSLYLQQVLRYDPLQIGFAFLPATLVMGTMSFRFAAPLAMRFGARRTLLPGMLMGGLALLLFARAPVHGNYWRDVLPVMLLLGFGMGSSFPALMTLSMAGASREDAGLASGLVNTTAQVGGAVGLAVLATLASTRTSSLHGRGVSSAAALTSGFHLAFLVGAALLACAVLVIVFALEAPWKATPMPHGAPGSDGEFNPDAAAPHGAGPLESPAGEVTAYGEAAA